MNNIESKLKSMGYELPKPFVFPNKNRRGCVRVGNMLYISGHGLDLPPDVWARMSDKQRRHHTSRTRKNTDKHK
jgi:hypothetical protein